VLHFIYVIPSPKTIVLITIRQHIHESFLISLKIVSMTTSSILASLSRSTYLQYQKNSLFNRLYLDYLTQFKSQIANAKIV